MQDRPTAKELLDALAGFMRDRAEHARDRWERFQFQVAANSIGILSRETELEDGFMRSEWRRLDDLFSPETPPVEQPAFVARLGERNAELVRAIADGRFDGDREPALLAHLWQTTVDKVRIASPNEAP